MRVAIAYPPIVSEKGVPLLSQNRQFQWFNHPTFIYPVVPACAATMARKAGHDVFWLDGIASGWSEEQFLLELQKAAPDLIYIEAKTPIIKAYWAWVDRIKALFPAVLVVLVGDHVTALPSETFEQCRVDYVLTGGDHDFMLVHLLEHLQNPSRPLDKGVWFRKDGAVTHTGSFVLDSDLKQMPWIDRDLTQWRLYSTRNGNYRRIPGTYIMSGRDCWHGKCTFCSWTTLYPNYRSRDPIDVVNEIEHLVHHYGVREIMDDTGSFPIGPFLKTFCEEMIRRGLNQRVSIDCNMRFGHLTAMDYKLMKKAGFRLVLFGLESGNQVTLDRLVKALNVEDILAGARAAREAGLDVHVTVMLGFPWETAAEVEKTVALARQLLIRGYAYTLQVTQVVPYPGTPLFREAREAGWLKTMDWDEYDMRMNVMSGNLTDEQIKCAIRTIYRAFMHPVAIWNRLIHTTAPIEDAKFYWRGFKALLGHLRDFG
jgi:radical SAM superfamily enzyme YgiQ (UPF0313 family)